MPPTTTKPPCPTCNGQRLIANPDGSQWQLCPMCGGSGQWTLPGLPIFYGVDFTLTALQAQSANILIQDYTFRWMWATAKSTGTFTFTIKDQRTGRLFQYVTNPAGTPSSGVQGANFWGTGQNIGVLPIPYEFPARDVINVVVTDTSNANNTVNLTFIGAELPSASQVAQGN